MKKYSFIIAILLTFSFNFAFADTNTQTNTNSTSTNSASASAQTTAASSTADQNTAQTAAPVIPPLIQQINQAKQMLQSVNLTYALTPHYKTLKATKTSKARTIIRNYTADVKQIALAIIDPSTNQITITKGNQYSRTFEFPDPSYDIQALDFNGVNTTFQVNKPAGGVVLAVKYCLIDQTSGSKAAIDSSVSQVVYVPYSSSLQFADVAKYGEQYINSVLYQAQAQLANVPSVSQPGMTIIQAIKPSIVKALLYAEHMDTSEFIYNPDTQSLIDKINILYAANQGDTFKYAVSSGNARGIAQFIPSTYRGLVARHPEANLNPDFIAGMADHVNAVKAEYLLLDDYIQAVHQRISDNFNPAYQYDYAAASYNGGVARVAKAVEAYGQNWYSDHSQDISNTELQVAAESDVVKNLKYQAKHGATTADRTAAKSEVPVEQQKLAALNSQLSAMKTSALKNETVLYLDKMHKLISIFNSEL